MGPVIIMSVKDKEKWNQKYQTTKFNSGREPCEWLNENSGLLPGKGRALDIACGEGRNAVFAASLGYDVLGIDISDMGLKNARQLAGEKKLHINTLATDLDDFEFEENAFDLVLCFYFLDRKLFPCVRKSLKPGGWVVYETFSEDHLKYTGFKKEWVLGANELLKEFQGFHVLRYREVDLEDKGFASLVARKKEK